MALPLVGAGKPIHHKPLPFLEDENMTDTTESAAPEATTTPPVAEAAQVDPAQELEALKAKYSKAQADLTKFRTRADEVAAAQKAAEEKALAEADAVKKAELLAAKVAELEKAAAEATAKAAAAERRAALTGKVSDLDLALAVADRHTTDGVLDVDALLAAHPSLAPAKPGVTPTPGAGGTIARTGDLTSEDFRNKPPEWIKANLHRLKPPTQH